MGVNCMGVICMETVCKGEHCKEVSKNFNSILMPSYPLRKFSFHKYAHLGKQYKLFQGEYVEALCLQSDDPYLYYIIQGKIQLFFERPDGSFVMIAHRDAGNVFQAEYFNFASIGNDQLRFLAIENSVVVSFTKGQLFELFKEDSQLLEDFFYVVHMTYATLAHRLLNTADLHSSQKFLTWLYKLIMSNKQEDNGVYEIECNLTQQQIADLLFIHVTTCNKLIAALEKEGIIKKTKTHIYVYDAERIFGYLESDNKIIY
ncbi:MAG: Crp/Fnr family transcriptional regulator [Bacillota bacterium]